MLTYTADTIKMLRGRKKWTQIKLLIANGEQYETELRLVEKGRTLPREENLKKLLRTLEAPKETIQCPPLENQPMNSYIMRYNLLQALINDDLPNALNFYAEIKALPNMDTPVNRQFLLSQHARILEKQGHSPGEILPQVMEALNLTYNNFNETSPGDTILLFEETELFHTLARMHIAQGNTPDAVRILIDLARGLLNMPIGAREKEKQLSPILLTLCTIYLKTQEYAKAIDACKQGIDVSNKRNGGRYSPQFLLMRAIAFANVGELNDARKHFQLAYMGNALLHENEKMKEVLEQAQKYNISFNLYGVEKLILPPPEKELYKRGVPPQCHTLGDLIRILHEESGLTQKELCQGIVSPANFSKMKNNEIQAHVHYVEPLLQRLGRDPLLLCNFFLNKEDFDGRELRDKVHTLLVQGEHDKAEEALGELKKYKAYASRANLQFIKRVEIALYSIKHGLKNDDVPVMLIDAIHITCPKFDEQNIHKYPLTLDEFVLISHLAGCYLEMGETRRAANMYEKLIISLNNRYVDEEEKARTYAPAMNDLATCLGRLGLRKEALSIVDKAEKFNRNRGRLSSLPVLVGTKAYNKWELGQNDVAIPYFTMAYYGFHIFLPRYQRFVEITQNLMKKEFDVDIY